MPVEINMTVTFYSRNTSGASMKKASTACSGSL
jgi:hypothetical protein